MQEQQAMKFFVGRGNNHHIVKAILRQRLLGNWTQKDKTHDAWAEEETPLDDVNFVWT